MAVASLSTWYYFNYHWRCFRGLVGWLGAILAIIGIVLGAIGRKNPEHKGIATGGLVCSIIGLILSLILYIACIGCTAGLASLY